MSAITVIKDPSNDSKALIEWVLPFNNFETITSLEIQFLKKNGDFQVHSECSPSNTDV